MISSGSGGVLVVLPRKSNSYVFVRLTFMQLSSDHSMKDRTLVSDSSKPTFASIGKLTVTSSANSTRRFLLVSTALIVNENRKEDRAHDCTLRNRNIFSTVTIDNNSLFSLI